MNDPLMDPIIDFVCDPRPVRLCYRWGSEPWAIIDILPIPDAALPQEEIL